MNPWMFNPYDSTGGWQTGLGDKYADYAMRHGYQPNTPPEVIDYTQKAYDIERQRMQEDKNWAMKMRFAQPSGRQYRGYANAAHDYTAPPAEVLINNLGSMGNPWAMSGGQYRQPTANISPWMAGR